MAKSDRNRPNRAELEKKSPPENLVDRAAEHAKITPYELAERLKRSGFSKSSVYHYRHKSLDMPVRMADEIRKAAGVAIELWQKWIDELKNG